MAVSTKLHADGGARASVGEFFRCPAFLRAEGVTHTLEAGPARLPVIVRDVPGADGLLDAISPYGYPGASLAGDAEGPDPAAVDWSPTGLVSLFVRDRIGEPRAFAGGTERSVVQVHDPARPRSVRPRLAEQARRNERGGWAAAAEAGPGASAGEREAFHALYTETMRRTGAGKRYLYEPSYFDAILAAEGSWLLAAERGDGEPGAGAIAVRSDGVLHYYLGGTAEAALRDSPFKNVVLAMLDLADDLALPLNLGGGLAPGDGLERFKRGFANTELGFVTHQVVCDPAAYERLSGPATAEGFFPAYRSG